MKQFNKKTYNMKRKQIVAGNWKMNKNFQEGMQLASDIATKMPLTDEVVVILGIPAIHLQAVGNLVKNFSGIKIAAQNCHQEEKGAYTGELSADMLTSVGVEYVILGHSERRQYFNETNELLAKKVDTVLNKGLHPIFCCGEALDIREKGKHIKYVKKQLEAGLFHLTAKQFSKVVIAYEPIWAIGTGVTASKEQAQEMHKSIRKLIADKYGKKIAKKTSILYGGSVKPANAKELFSQADVDGGLVGGASLKAADFIQVIEGFN